MIIWPHVRPRLLKGRIDCRQNRLRASPNLTHPITEEFMSRKTGLSMNRRTFVGSAFAGMSVLGLNAEVPKPPSGSIPMREFGKTGVKLTIVGQAGARLALCRTREAAGKVVLHAYDLGINYFDCAHSYWAGHSEETYGDVLPPFRENIFITTKSGQRTREGAEKDLHAEWRQHIAVGL